MENKKLAKIKDFILEVLKDYNRSNPLKEVEFLEKIYSKKYKKEDVDLMVKYLIENNYIIKPWDMGGERGNGCGIEDKGKIKLREGGFNKNLFKRNLTPTQQVATTISAIFAITSGVYLFGCWMNWW